MIYIHTHVYIYIYIYLYMGYKKYAQTFRRRTSRKQMLRKPGRIQDNIKIGFIQIL
jgi:hypothetical protein